MLSAIWFNTNYSKFLHSPFKQNCSIFKEVNDLLSNVFLIAWSSLPQSKNERLNTQATLYFLKNLKGKTKKRLGQNLL